MSDDALLTSQEAIQYVMDEFGYESYYSIARDLSSSYKGRAVQTGQVISYHNGDKVMSEKTAELFYLVFGIGIKGAYRAKGRPSEWQ